MKLTQAILPLMTLTVFSFASAEPAKVGTWWNVKGTITKPDGSVVAYEDLHSIQKWGEPDSNGVRTGEVTSFWKFDQEGAQWKFEIRYIKHSATDRRYEDHTNLTQTVQNCATNGGTPETITVLGGTFDTCKIVNHFTDPNEPVNTVWIAAVAGGEVKGMWEFANGNKYSYEYITGGFAP